MSILDKLVEALFGSSPGQADIDDRDLIAELTETIVDVVEPRVRTCPGYRDKLADGVRLTIGHLRTLGRVPLHPIVLSRNAWARDPHVHAFFADADAVAACIAGSQEVRHFLEAHPGCEEVFALLAMKRNAQPAMASHERAAAIRQDVTRKVTSFSDHRLLSPAADEAQVRLDVGRRIVRRLAQLVLLRILATNQRGMDLEMHRANLLVKWRMLQHARNGMQALVSDPASIDKELADLDRELDETTRSYNEAKRSLSTLDSYVDHINAVLSHPEQQVAVESVRIEPIPAGIESEESAPGETADELELTEISIGEGSSVTIALVRIPRTAVDPASVQPTGS